MSWKDKDREKELKRELQRLRETFKDLEGRKMEVAFDLCEELAALKVEMKYLKKS